MKWEKKSKYYSESDTGYRISVCIVNSKKLFIAWPPGRGPSLGVFRDGSNEEKVNAAVAACEAHARENSKAKTA